MSSQRLQKELERVYEMDTTDELLDALRRKTRWENGNNVLPQVKFTGQQPGEEGVERDSEPGEDDDTNEEPDDQRDVDEDGERVVPINDPKHKIPRV